MTNSLDQLKASGTVSTPTSPHFPEETVQRHRLSLYRNAMQKMLT